MQNTFAIKGLSGKQTLTGTISVNGSKNAVLEALTLPLIFKDTVIVDNVPGIEDVTRMIELLRLIGVSVKELKKGSYAILASSRKIKTNLPARIAGRFRASILLSGPILARHGKVTFPHPGGDKIGSRPVDLFLEGYRAMGALVRVGRGHTLTAPKKMHGAEIFLRLQSVTATQTLMVTGVLARGRTIIKNAALEPEIPHLANFLNSCGARISGAGTPTIVVEGTGPLSARGKKYRVLPDRLETGTFLILATLAGKDITITDCEPKHIEALLELVRHIASTTVLVGKDSIRVRNIKPLSLKSIDVKTHEYPGFITDFQPPFVVLLTQAKGKSLVFETIFEGRFGYVGNLLQMGAEIHMYDPHRIRVLGKTPLKSLTLASPDIRAGLAYILAATIAKGISVIHNVYCIDRGYERIEERLSKLGLRITRQ